MEQVGKILYTEEQIAQRAKELGAEISKDYEGETVVAVLTLRGAVMWGSELLKRISCDTVVDFIVASSYGAGTTSSGVVNISKDVETDVEGKNILIIEDIIETGYTLKLLKEYFYQRGAKSVKICTLLNKPSGRVVDIEGDYIGFNVGNLFIIGYGLDYDQKYRNLPYISYLEG